jgi:hypothetical protein
VYVFLCCQTSINNKVAANLRFLFGKDVDVFTCNVGDGSNVAAIAYMVGINGERNKVMQASSSDVATALRKLLDLSSKRVRVFLADCDHHVVYQDLVNCCIRLPHGQEASSDVNQPTLPEDDVAPLDKPVPEEKWASEECVEHVRAGTG